MVLRLFKRASLLSGLLVAGAIGASLVIAPLLGRDVLSVQSGSMAPAIKKGDAVIVTSVSNLSLKVGDVITFSADKSGNAASITHRIVELPSESNGNNYITKGDANPTQDQPVEPDRILGQVQTQLPLLGTVIDFATTPLGLALLVYLPALYIVIEELVILSRYFTKNKLWRDPSYQPDQSFSKLKLLGVVAFGTIAFSSPAWALLSDSATLTNNTISAIVDQGGGDGDTCTDGNSNTLDVDADIAGSGSTTIDIDVVTDQTATTGDATNSNNTSGGNATSGDATNCSSTDIDISISN